MAQKKKTYSVSGVASSPHYEYKKTKDETITSKNGDSSVKIEQYGKGDGSSKTITTHKFSVTKDERKKVSNPEDKNAYKGVKSVLNSKKTAVDNTLDGTTIYTKGSVKKDKNGTDKWNYKETEVSGSYRTDKNEKSKHKNTISSDEALAQAYANLKKKKKK